MANTTMRLRLFLEPVIDLVGSWSGRLSMTMCPVTSDRTTVASV